LGIAPNMGRVLWRGKGGQNKPAARQSLVGNLLSDSDQETKLSRLVEVAGAVWRN
jgi:hypothetical protein